MRLVDGMPWVESSATNIRVTLRKHGHVAPEQRAQETEQQSRHEGALRAMKRIQSEAPKATVTFINTTKEKRNAP